MSVGHARRSHWKRSFHQKLAAFACAFSIFGCAPAVIPAASSQEPAGSMVAVKTVFLPGPPTIRLKLGREYSILETHPKPAPGAPPKDVHAFMFNPKDEQSSAVLGVGADIHRKTELSIAKGYEGAKVTKIPGMIAGKTIEWWHYHDSHHLYSTCYLSLQDRSGREHQLVIDLVANREERLASLEATFSQIELK